MFQRAPNFIQRRLRSDHARMFLLVALAQGGKRGLDLAHIPASFHDCRCDRDARHRKQRIEIVAGLFDLRELAFETHSLRFGRA